MFGVCSLQDDGLFVCRCCEAFGEVEFCGVLGFGELEDFVVVVLG